MASWTPADEMRATSWVRACNGASGCVEARWVSAPCNNGACVEAHICPESGEVRVRDSKNPDGPTLAYTASEWTAFVDALRADQLGAYAGPVLLVGVDDAWRMWRDSDWEPSLAFDGDEVRAFVAGVRGGRFGLAALSAVHDSDGKRSGRPLAPPLAVRDAVRLPV